MFHPLGTTKHVQGLFNLVPTYTVRRETWTRLSRMASDFVLAENCKESNHSLDNDVFLSTL